MRRRPLPGLICVLALMGSTLAMAQNHYYYTFAISGESNVCLGVDYTYTCPYPASWNVGSGGQIMGGSSGSIVVRWNSYDGMSISATYEYSDPPNCWYEPDVIPPVLVCDPINHYHYSSNHFALNPALQSVGLTGGNGCVGSPVSVRLTGSQIGVAYQLRRDGSNIGAAVNGTGGEINFGGQTVPGNYTVIGTRTSNGCSAQVGSTNVFLFSSVGGTLTGGVTTCGSATGWVALAGHQGNVFSWEQNNGSGWSTITSNSSSAFAYTVSQPTRYRALVYNNGCPGAYSTEALIDASPATFGGTLSGGGIFCNAASGALSLAGHVGAVVRWESFNGSAWIAIANTSTTLSFSRIGSETRYRAIVKSGTCSEVASTEALIQVYPSAAQSISISSNKTSVCPGEGIQFQVSSETAIGAGPTYQWFVNGVQRSSDVALGPKVLVINNWNYANNSSVTCRVNSSLPPCASNNPATSNGITISVNPSQNFTVGLSVLPARNPMTYCPGEISFQANASHSPTGISWFKNGVFVGSGTSYTPAEFLSSDVVSVTATSGSMCLLNTQASASTSGMPISIRSLVTVGAVNCDICNLAARCQGAGSTFFSSSVQNADGITWTLENGGSSTINPSTGEVTWASNFSGTATVRVTATGCAGPQSATRAISVTPAGGSVSIAISSNKSTVCPGEGIQFQVSGESNIGSSPVYQWLVNGSPRASDSGSDPKVFIVNSWNYSNNASVTCRVTSNTACTINNPATSNPITIGVNALQPFSVGISILPSKSPLSYCPDEISFQANPSHPASSYAWTRNGNPTILSTSQTFDPSTIAPGDWVSVTAYAANTTCLANISAGHSTQGVPLTIYTGLPGVSITTADAGSRCQGPGTTQFAVSGVVPSPFQWIISSAGNSTINATTGLVTWDPAFTGTAQIEIRLIPCPTIRVTQPYPVIAPGVPVANPATGISTVSFTANWTAAACAASYQLDVSTTNLFSSFVPGFSSLPVAGTSQVVTGLTAGTTYFYRVRSVRGSIVSANSPTIPAITLTQTPVAKAPTGILVSSFTANWDPVPGATGYRLDVSPSNTFATFLPNFNNLAVTGTTHSVTGLTAGTVYHYRVRAVNGSGVSSNSNSILALTLPAPPALNPATTITANSFTASWSPVPSVTEYRLDVSTAITFANFLPGFNNLQLTTTSRSVTGLQAGTTYFYRVRAVNGSGVSANSPTPAVLTLPPAPIALPASSQTRFEFTANWSAAQSATSYRLDVSSESNFGTFLTDFNNRSVSATNFTVAGLTPGTSYFYRVRAVNATGESLNSAFINTMTVPEAPVATNATMITSNSFRANWNAVAGATAYRLDVSTSSDFSNLLPAFNDLSLTATSHLVTPLTIKESSYYYRVRAINAGGVSTNSNVVVAVDLDRNYVRSTNVLVPNVVDAAQIDLLPVGRKSVSTSFVDGLGRPIQQVMWQQSPNGNDFVQPVAYDPFGREATKYLPFTAGDDGWLKPDFLPKESANYTSASNPQHAFYQNTNRVAGDLHPYADAVMEASPLNRIIKQGSPGQAWQPDGVHGYNSTDRTIKKSYEFNLANEVLLWTYTAASATFPFGRVNAGTAAAPVYYAVNQLTKTRTKDEQQNEVIEFTDKQGRVVLKRVQVNATQYASTYYIYDDLGQLVCVLPPEATNRLSTEYFHASATDATKDAFLRRWAFRYRYDHRRRMILKIVPGADSVRMVYDNRDRLILTQDGNQRAGSPNIIKYWSFTKYDELNRPILTGIKDTTIATATVHMTQAQMQAIVNAHFAKPSARWGERFIGNAPGNVHGYTNRAYPVNTGSTASQVDPNKYLTATYYDHYDFRATWVGSYAYVNEGLTETDQGITYTQPTSENLRVIGQTTGAKIKVLDGGFTGGFTWLKSITYYDEKYRVAQTISDNYKGGTDRTSFVVDFTGQVLESRLTFSEADVAWRDRVGVGVRGNVLTRTVNSTAGAASVQSLPAGQNGWIECTISETNTNRFVGLNDTNPDALATNIDYAFYINGATLRIVENNVTRLTVPGALTPGEVLRIERIGGQIRYLRNGVALTYANNSALTGALFADVSFATTNATLVDVRASFATVVRTIARRMEYDHAGRLLRTWHRIDNQPEILLALNEYNELGQLVDKKLHSTVASGGNAKQSVDYRYNIRGWLTSMNNARLANEPATNDDTNDLFGMELGYNNMLVGLGNTGLFNGNISGIMYSSYGNGPIKEKGYTYSYDAMNRLTGSTYKERTGEALPVWDTPGNNAFAETGFSYDLNGNILTLTRNDRRATGQMDLLQYNYGTGTSASNLLLRVTDNGDDFRGFVDGTNTGNDYTYDANGNMTRDLNKGIGTSLSDNTNRITYNFLNLPETVTKGGNSIRYVYDAAGRKLSQVVSFGNQQKLTDYAAEFVFENDVLQFVNHEEGRIAMSSLKPVYTNPGENTADFVPVNTTLASVTINDGQKYVRVTSVGTTARSGVFPIGGTIAVAPGERYIVRAKGYRTGANPVHLWVRANGVDLNWPGATLPSLLANEAWTEQTVTVPTGATALQVGVVWNTVTAGEQYFLNDFEITKLETNAPEYQYHLKDHLGNVRLTFTSKEETLTETATYEPTAQNTEQSQFVRYATAKLVNTSLFDRTNGAANGYAQRLNGSANERYGLAKSISVMPGDVIQAEVYAKYVDPVSSNWNGALATLMTQIAGGAAGVVVDGSAYATSTGSFPFAGLLSTNDTGAPRAYLNWLVFDRNYGFITGGFRQISTTAKEAGTDVAHELIAMPQAITINQPGYVYIYLSNENATPVEVYFDDFKVMHTKSPVIQSDSFYPFGLTFDSYTRENSVPNKFKFQSQEHIDDLGLGWIQFKWRNHMPDIGRFFNVDPLADKYVYNSPYAFAENKVINGNELEGLELGPTHFEIYQSAKVQGRPMSDVAQEVTGAKAMETPQGRAVMGAIAEVGGGLVPGVAQVIDAKDTYNAFASGDGLDITFAMAAWVPGLDFLKSGKKVSNAVEGASKVEKYEVGLFNDLKSRSEVGDGLDIHHVSQKQPAGQVIEGYNPNTAPSIALPSAEHKQIPILKGTQTSGGARQQLAKDVKDLRQNTNAPNQSLQQLIDLNKKTYPDAFKKPN